ncbi:hypothetical protein HN51_061972 [Arachis hypogaea]
MPSLIGSYPLTQIPETHTAATLLTASVAHRRCCLLCSVAHRRRRSVAHLAALPHRTHFARTSLVDVTLLAARLFDLQSPVPPSFVVVSLRTSLSTIIIDPEKSLDDDIKNDVLSPQELVGPAKILSFL